MPGAFAGAAGAAHDAAVDSNRIATPALPVRLDPKRSASPRPTQAAAPRVNIAAPQLPFRLYQKIPTAAPSTKPGIIEAAKRQ